MRRFQSYGSMSRVALTLLFLCFVLPEAVWAQGQPLSLPESSGESLILSCDREIYGVSEKIQYHASYTGPAEIKSDSWSTVLYVELIDWKGTKQATSKVLIEDGGFSGEVDIPQMIASGVYYLRAYTLWMRNYSPYSYAYLPLRILNPYSQEMLARPAEAGSTYKLLMERSNKYMTEGFVVDDLKESYGCGEQVELAIRLDEGLITGPYSLGISKTQSLSSADFITKPAPDLIKGSGELEFLPEINGMTLSGHLISAESNEPVKDATMQLSSYADPFLYAEVLSGKDGSFIYTLPHLTGDPELHIRAVSDSLSDHQILLSSEFCNKPVRLAYVPLSIDSAEQSLVREILVNTQLKERYGMHAGQSPEKEYSYPSFYGKGASVTYVRDYIELRDLREFIYEIIPQVSIQSKDNASYVSIQGPDCLDIYPPLVLMDNVPVPNNDELLNIPGKRIERIEVVNRAYMVGNTRYSGILSIYSSKKDMSGLAQVGERHFFNLGMLDLRGQDDEVRDRLESSAPDTRNLLYWDPEISSSDQTDFQLVFNTPDTPGTYVLTLRGTDAETGESMLGKAIISVK